MRYSTELLDRILTSAEGKTILGFVSPIYGNSYVGLWIFQAIGLQLDDLRQWVTELPDQALPQTATWGLPYWEDEFGITPPVGATTESRQREILAKLAERAPVNPTKLAALVSAATGRTATIQERTAPYTFFIQIDITAAGAPFSLDFYKKVDIMKPAHLIYSWELTVHGTVTVAFSEKTGIFNAPKCGTKLCGTYPGISTIGELAGGIISIGLAEIFATFNDPLCGTIPGISTIGDLFSITVGISASEETAHFVPPLPGDSACGTKPSAAQVGAFEYSKISLQEVDEASAFTSVPCGAEPSTSTAGISATYTVECNTSMSVFPTQAKVCGKYRCGT